MKPKLVVRRYMWDRKRGTTYLDPETREWKPCKGLQDARKIAARIGRSGIIIDLK